MTTLTATRASLRAELLRLRKWPAVWTILAAWLLLTTLFGYAFDYVSYTTGSSTFATDGIGRARLLADLLPAHAPHVLVQGMPMFGGALMMVLGAIVAGNGYGWGTWKTALTQGPSRTATGLGSLGAMSVFIAGTVVASLALCLALSLGVAGLESQPVVWPAVTDVLTSCGVGLLVLEMWGLAGWFLGTLVRGAALSVGFGLVWAMVLENLLRGVGTLLSPVEAFTKITPGTGAGSLVGWLVGTGGPDSTPGVLDELGLVASLAVVSSYLVLLPLGSLALVRRRDVG